MPNMGMTDQQICNFLRDAAGDSWSHLIAGRLTFSQKYAISRAPDRLEALAAENVALRDALTEMLDNFDGNATIEKARALLAPSHPS